MRLLLALVLLAWTGIARAESPSDAAWKALREGGSVAVLRHARAPGTGDPADFRLGDCPSQRNLSSEGREQATRIGARFRAEGVPVERVLSSRWCRSLDTATLAFGAAQPFPSLDSFFSGRERQDAQTRTVRSLVSQWRSKGVLVLVTHQVNITALTGVFPAEGEVVVLMPKAGADFEILGRVAP